MPVHSTEFFVLIVLAIVVLGPKQLPEYAAKLARLVVTARRMANDAKGQLKEQMGPEFQDVNWRQYDPRQYDPRRIVREALMEPLEDAFSLEDRPAGATRPEATATELDEWPDPDGDAAVAVAGGTPWDRDAT